MNLTVDFRMCKLLPMEEKFAKEISQWVYKPPYEAYSFQGQNDEYLMDTALWGVEQFVLLYDKELVGQAACQFEKETLWVGWSMRPDLCGNGYGAEFVKTCVSQLCSARKHSGPVLLRVAASNQRAVKAYQKAGFCYKETIIDEVAFSDHMEDFWVMEKK